MQAESWDNLQRVWKGEKKPDLDIEELRDEVNKRDSRKKLRIVGEILIVFAVILLTIFRLTNQPSPFDYIFIGQLWFITILALAFNLWNRSSLKRADTFSHAQYLKLLLHGSLKKRRTAVFVFVLTILNLLFYAVLFGTGHIDLSNTKVLAGTAVLLLIYTAWSGWYYKISTIDMEYYREKLSKTDNG